MEAAARALNAKLPKLKITPFKGTSFDKLGFENMFITASTKRKKILMSSLRMSLRKYEIKCQTSKQMLWDTRSIELGSAEKGVWSN